MRARVCHLIQMQEPELSDGLLFASGDTVPTDAADGYRPGCIFQHTDGAAGSMFYINEGSATWTGYWMRPAR